MTRVLSTTRSRRNPIYVQLTEYEGRRLCDIRRFFFDSKTHEYKATQKGISLNAENFKQVLEIIHENVNDIADWLEIKIAEKKVSDSVEDQGILEERARDRARESGRKLETHTVSEPRELFPYRYGAEGATEHISENLAHPLTKYILGDNDTCNSRPETPETRSVIQDIFHAYFVAMERVLSTSRDGSFDREQFEFEWDRVLRYNIGKRKQARGDGNV